MSTQHYSRKTNQGDKGTHRPGVDFEDEGRDSDLKPKFGRTTDNRSHRERDEESRFTDDRPSESHCSNFGDDEIGGTSFDPRPVQSEEKRRKERNVKKEGTTPDYLDDRK